MRRSAWLASIVLALVAAAPLHAQNTTTARLAITSVKDSTFTFTLAGNRWVQPQMRGVVVDPERRDALVARFRVLAVAQGSATAVVTGQTTALTRQHAVLLARPQPPLHAQRSFWGGVATGVVVGVIVRSLF